MKKTTFSLEKVVAKMRLYYHANMLDVNNALNRLHLMSNERNAKSNMKHITILINDVLPRLDVAEEMTKDFVKE